MVYGCRGGVDSHGIRDRARERAAKARAAPEYVIIIEGGEVRVCWPPCIDVQLHACAGGLVRRLGSGQEVTRAAHTLVETGSSTFLLFYQLS